MRPLVLIVLIETSLIVSGCSKKTEKVSEPVSGRAPKLIYSDTTPSSIEITEAYSKSAEVRYDHFSMWNEGWHPYIAKVIVMTYHPRGAMGYQVRVKAELTSLEASDEKKIIIDKECHLIDFKEDYYETIKRGCCGAEDEIALYDYQNKLIIEGTSTIARCIIPNSHLKFFVSIDGGIRLSYGSDDQYHIQIVYPPGFKGEDCGPIPPDIRIESSNSKDRFDASKNEYEFWSLNKAKLKDGVNNLIIKVNWTCDVESEPISIPIVNGKPFGKEEREQSVKLILK